MSPAAENLAATDGAIRKFIDRFDVSAAPFVSSSSQEVFLFDCDGMILCPRQR